MATQCFQLTPAQLTSYLASGYTLVSGPYATQQQCNANCGGSSSSSTSQSSITSISSSSTTSSAPGNIVTQCCPNNPIPATLTCVFSGGVTGTFTLIWSPANGDWLGTFFVCGNQTSTWSIRCVKLGPVFHWFMAGDGLPGTGCSTQLTQATSEDCVTPQFVFNLTGPHGSSANCCDSLNWTATVT